jgi:hypothetical protein
VRGLSIVANLQKPFRPVDMKKRLKLIAREFVEGAPVLAEDAA